MAVDNSKITKVGSGFAKELKISLNDNIRTGITITVSDDPSYSSSFSPIRYSQLAEKLPGMPVFSASPNSFAVTTPAGNPYAITVTGLNGKIVKRYQGFGAETFHFGASARSASAPMAPGVYVVQLPLTIKCFQSGLQFFNKKTSNKTITTNNKKDRGEL